MNERTDRKANEQWMKNQRKESEISQLAINRNKKKTAYSSMRDLNFRPLVYETSALTTELTRLILWLSK